MGYDKFRCKYYLDHKDKDYINIKIEYYIQRLDGVPLKIKYREWFKISKYWYSKASNTSDIKYKTIYKAIAKRCYKYYQDYKNEYNNKFKEPVNNNQSLTIGDFF